MWHGRSVQAAAWAVCGVMLNPIESKEIVRLKSDELNRSLLE